MKNTIFTVLKKSIRPLATIIGLLIAGFYIGVAIQVEYIDLTLAGGILMGLLLAIVGQFARFENQ